jgi:hypothetical protein
MQQLHQELFETHWRKELLKKMTLKVNLENTLVIYQYGHKILFDGYLIMNMKEHRKTLNINRILI